MTALDEYFSSKKRSQTYVIKKAQSGALNLTKSTFNYFECGLSLGENETVG